ncbi:MAG: hypothetical protein OXD48_05520 [Litoreibacter sp.]|nr:hypothetical protein [Litoreibacter sp.]
MIKRILTAAALVVGGLLTYVYLFAISPKDVVAYHELAAPVNSEVFRAGDLVAISPDGQNLEGRICSMDVTTDDIDMVPLSKEYSNSLRDHVPDFTNLVNWGKGLVGIPGTDEEVTLAKADRIPFVGHVSAVRDASVNPMMSQDCACAVARSLIKRQKVCTVRRSLVESVLVDARYADQDGQRNERTIGVTFRAGSIVIPNLELLTCEGPALNLEARAPAQEFDCSTVGGHQPDVFLRAKLGVIRESEIEEAPTIQ